MSLWVWYGFLFFRTWTPPKCRFSFGFSFKTIPRTQKHVFASAVAEDPKLATTRRYDVETDGWVEEQVGEAPEARTCAWGEQLFPCFMRITQCKLGGLDGSRWFRLAFCLDWALGNG